MFCIKRGAIGISSASLRCYNFTTLTRTYYKPTNSLSTRLPVTCKYRPNISLQQNIQWKRKGYYRSYSTSKSQDKQNDKNGKEKNKWGSIWELFKLAKPEKWFIIGSMGLIVVTSSVSMLVPSVIGKLIDVATENEEENKKTKEEGREKEEKLIYGLTKFQFFAGLSGIFIVGAIANTGRIIILKMTGEKIVARLRTRTMKNILKQDGVFQGEYKVGDLISRLSTDASIVSNAVTKNISDGARAVIQGCVGVTMMSIISLQLSGVMLVLVPPLGILATIYGRKIRNISRKLQESVGALSKVSEEQLNAVRTIQAYGGEKLEIRKYAKEVRTVFEVGLNEATVSGIFYGVTGLLGNTALISLLYVGCNMIEWGTLTIGELSSFMMYAVYTGSSLFGLSSFFSEIMKGSGAASRIFEIDNYQPLISATKGINPISLSNKPVIFNNVKFSYPNRLNHRVFNALSLKIEPGEHVCFVGASGCGKSTIATLLLRHYDPIEGEIKIGEDKIKDYSVRRYRKLIGIVEQEPILFNGTIKENICYNIPEEITNDSNRMRNAIIQSNCYKFLSTLPMGLDTPVGPRGTQLSGGQKQRVALARQFLLNPSILVLDEATSALDPNSELMVAAAIKERIAAGMTTISIAHRVSTIKHSTRVIVLGKEGNILETGKYEELATKRDSALTQLLLSQNKNHQIEKTHETTTTERQLAST